MESPLAVANYFVKKSFDTGVNLTPMKLVKLVYIAHGWYLALTEGPLLDEPIQAWKYGPVVESVYHGFKSYRDSQIKGFYKMTDSACNEVIPIVENENVKRFLDKVWEKYSTLNGLQLSTITHQPNTPWDRIWNKEKGKNYMGAIIPNNYIKEHYLNLMTPTHAS